MRLTALLVRNYKRIGEIECEIRIDRIVVLIGRNNVGKSTILDAYEQFASNGAKLSIDHFHNQDSSHPIEITGIFCDPTKEDLEIVGSKWAYQDPEYGTCIKVKWQWTTPDQDGIKYSFDPTSGSFIKGGVGGWDSQFASRIPKPVRVKPTESIETTQNKLLAILKDHVKSELKSSSSITSEAFEKIDQLSMQIFEQARTRFEEIADKITKNISQVFPETSVELVPRAKNAIDEKIIAADSFLRVRAGSDGQTPLLQQGTGIQRALLWSTLSILTDDTAKKRSKTPEATTRILLIDEPEAFLHPPAIRAAREALYKLALENSDWQVLATTHSPIFIDVSKEHTTIIRVEPDNTTSRYISTDAMSFNEPQRQRLQMIRACNPIVNEFFFHDSLILIEGPTEQAVLAHISVQIDRPFHVINCMGKANVPLFQRILNHFGASYIVIHDSDTPAAKRKSAVIRNPAWKLNEDIRELAEKGLDVCIFTQVPNFEGEFLDEDIKSGKVDRVLELLADAEDPNCVNLISTYLAVLNRQSEVMTTSIEAFEQKVADYQIEHSTIDSWRWAAAAV